MPDPSDNVPKAIQRIIKSFRHTEGTWDGDWCNGTEAGGHAAGVASKNCRMSQQREGSESVVCQAKYLSTDLLSLREALHNGGCPAVLPSGTHAVLSVHAGQPGCSAGRG